MNEKNISLVLNYKFVSTQVFNFQTGGFLNLLKGF